MKKSEITVILVACLLFAIGIPSKNIESARNEVRQEEQAEEDIPEMIDLEGERYKVTHQSSSAKEESILDIVWLRKAAEVAADAGVPHFNVINKKTYKTFSPESKRQMKTIEGTIELDNDPMEAEYDADEILSLVLVD